jgi:hypothetical protein
MAMASTAPGMQASQRLTPRTSRSATFGKSPKGDPLKEATVPAIVSVANGIGPRVEELETVITYQLKATKEEAESLISEQTASNNVEEKLNKLKDECAQYLAAKRDEMRKRSALHKAEGERMQKQISRLKDEHCQHQQALLSLQRRFSDLELFIGD